MPPKNIRLNLDRDILQGWEEYYDSLNLEALRIAVKLGHKLPPIDVVKDEGIYRLVFGMADIYSPEWENYGGHTRAVLALQERYPIECKIFDAHRTNPAENKTPINYHPISELKPQRRITHDSLSRLKTNLEYLPEKLRKIFTDKNDLFYTEDGSLIDGDNYRNPPPF